MPEQLTTAARGVLAIARAVLATYPETTLDELVAQLGSTFGGKRPELRRLLQDAELFGPAVDPNLPLYVVAADHGWNGKSKHVVYGVFRTRPEPWRLIFPSAYQRFAGFVADGLNLGLERDDAHRRALAVDQLVGGDGGQVHVDFDPTTSESAFVCDLRDQRRAWGPFESIEAAEDWRWQDGDLRVWAVTTRFPYSAYYPPACFGLFRPEEDRLIEPQRSRTDARDMTPDILDAVVEYMQFQNETNRGKAGVAFDKLEALLKRAGANGIES